MVVFGCVSCGAALTPGLVELSRVPAALSDPCARDPGTSLAPSTVPRGYYVVDPDPAGSTRDSTLRT